ncbi:hypothetical protein EBB79_17875 [Parasedimentitalea marina]|uniref:MAPEG family protein n=1 Tax=Parasedimentitalea marina TaxID=2483033 RepID=A0A3T0N682_9RHOB|nr:MAPEG family protein [Parasedimentitalea marina]AZV79556.1 hypothetical protein EBB79_17875 [Parasedimentitalea marina]
MLTWILLVLILYYAGLFLPSMFLIPQIGVGAYLGSRDGDPSPVTIHARAQRAHRNFQENLAPFVVLATLALVLPDVKVEQATLGATVFFFARLVYLPTYLMAVPVIRSAAYTVGFVGLILMGLALM